jgi:hypothetical protein
MFEVYICDNFEVGNGVLTIWEAKLIGKVKDEIGFNILYNMHSSPTVPNAIICPDLFYNKEEFDIISFE